MLQTEFPFTGRKELLHSLTKRVLGLKEGYRQNIALLGSPYIGKSALIQKFLSDLDEEDVLPIYLDLEGKDEHYFFSKFARSILYHFAKIKNLTVHEDLNLLMEETHEYIPETICHIQKVFKLVEQRKFTPAYSLLLTIPEIFNRETDIYSLIIFDEFQMLDSYEIEDAFKYLGDKIMTQKKCLYIVASSYEQVAQKILSEKLALLFGNFETLYVSVFDSQTAQNYIDQCLGDLKIGVQLKNFLIDFTGGHPLYLTILLKELINLSAIHQQEEIYAPLLSQSIENMVFNRWGVLSRHFELLINYLTQGKNNRSITLILIALSEGHYKLRELTSQLEIKQSNVSQKINGLIQQGLIEKNGNYFYFKDKLFRYWVKYVYKKKLMSLDVEFNDKHLQFKDEIYKSINNFQTNFRKDLSDRLIDLLHCFSDEVFTIEGRKYKLPAFNEIGISKMLQSSGQSLDVIRAACSDGEWQILLKKDALQESELNEYVQSCRSNNCKPRRCVIISLSELDENARVRALEERMWIWNEAELNVLMNLYNKPFVV